KSHGDEAILRAQELIETEIAHASNVDGLARRVAMSRRTFVRRFHRATGNSPREYIQRVRVESAKRLLEAGNLSIAQIARRVGYGDAVGFRKIFVRCTGVTPADYRVRYGARTAPSWVLPPRVSKASRARVAASSGR